MSSLPEQPAPPSSESATYRPAVFYFRRALRESPSHARAVAVGLAVCRELERLKAWVREQGMIPPKWHADPEEVKAKGWTEGGNP